MLFFLERSRNRRRLARSPHRSRERRRRAKIYPTMTPHTLASPPRVQLRVQGRLRLFLLAPFLASAARLGALDPPRPPGVVIDRSPAPSGIYLGSPGIAALPDGSYLAKCDEFGPGSTERARAVTRVYRSGDRGESWTRIADVHGAYWASIFVHRGAVYLMGTSKLEGSAVILRSDDGGRTWTEPRDGQSGLLLASGKHHCAPVPVVEHGGRIWRAMEDVVGSAGWGKHFRAFMMSAPAGADLLRAESWTSSNRLERNPLWLDEKFGGWLEGNAVVRPEGDVVNVLRVDHRPGGGSAAVIRVSDDGRWTAFDSGTGFIRFPGGSKKFTIRHDPVTRLYWSLSNLVPTRHRSPNPERVRNTLALISSPDLVEWSLRSVLLYHPDAARHGFQYIDWLLEGEDIIAASRTAYDDADGGAHNQHDANFLTFHRFRGFRALTLADSPDELRGELVRERKPHVLILGDSISIGYTAHVRKALCDVAVVVRPVLGEDRAENCEGTTCGLAQIDRWLRLGDGVWDVIHFNFGLHDMKRVIPESGAPSNNPGHPRQGEPERYGKQLEEIVTRLAKTGARLIFATTTPVPPGGVRPHRDVEDPARYNEVAARVLVDRNVAIDDLHAFAVARLKEIQLPANVHFTEDGSRVLGEEVARAIRAALPAAPAAPVAPAGFVAPGTGSAPVTK